MVGCILSMCILLGLLEIIDHTTNDTLLLIRQHCPDGICLECWVRVKGLYPLPDQIVPDLS